MPVATRLQIQGMRHAINTLFNRMSAIIPDPELTHEEITEIWAPKEHHELLRTAADIAYATPISRGVSLRVPFAIGGVNSPSVDIKLTNGKGRTAPLVPRLPVWQEAASPDASDRLSSWLDKRLEVGRQFGLVKHVFDVLTTHFQTGAQVRYVWPSVLLLARNAPIEQFDLEDGRKKIQFAELCDAWAKKHAEFRQVGHPKLSLEFRKALQETGAVITAASMLTDEHVDAANRLPREVELSVSPDDTFPFDGANIPRM